MIDLSRDTYEHFYHVLTAAVNSSETVLFGGISKMQPSAIINVIQTAFPDADVKIDIYRVHKNTLSRNDFTQSGIGDIRKHRHINLQNIREVKRAHNWRNLFWPTGGKVRLSFRQGDVGYASVAWCSLHDTFDPVMGIHVAFKKLLLNPAVQQQFIRTWRSIDAYTLPGAKIDMAQVIF